MRSSQLPPGTKVVDIKESFIVDGPVDLDLVKVEQHANDDALILASGATGRIERIEIDTYTQDGVKVQNATAQACHDFEINGGYVWCHEAAGGAHQDGFQVMGGARITVRNVLVRGADTQGIFINKAGSGATTPTDILFENCKVGCANANGGPATPVNVNTAVRSGISNCEVWTSPRFGRSIVVSSGNINENNTVMAQNAPGCDVEPGGPPPPPPPPADSLPLHVVSETATEIVLGWTPVANAVGYRFSRSDQEKRSHTWDQARSSVKFGKADGVTYKVEALMLGAFGDYP